MNSFQDLFTLLPTGGWQRLACDALWQSAVIAGFGYGVAKCFRRRAAVRAWVLLLTLSACLIVPLASSASRSAGWGVLVKADSTWRAEEGENGSVGERERLRIEPISVLAAAPDFAAESAQTVVPLAGEQTAATELPIADLDSSEPLPTITASAQTKSATPTISPSPFLPFSPASVFAAVWLAASVILAVRLLLGTLAVRRILRRAVVCDDVQLLAAAQEAARRVGLRRTPAVLTSADIESPMILALGKPRLLVPQSSPLASQEDAAGGAHNSAEVFSGNLGQHSTEGNAATTANVSRSEKATLGDIDWTAAFTHELAHVTRRDGWSRLWAELITIALPLQPLIWLARRSFYFACEEACDDWSVAAGSDPVELAATLTAWLGGTGPGRAAVIGMSSNKHRVLRLLAMHEKPSAKVPRVGRWLSVPTALFIVVGLAMAQTPNSTPSIPPTPAGPNPIESGSVIPPTSPDAGASKTDDTVAASIKVGEEYIAEKQTAISKLQEAIRVLEKTSKAPQFDNNIRQMREQIEEYRQEIGRWRNDLALLARKKSTTERNTPSPSIGAYVIDPPDVIKIDIVKATPKEPTRIAPLDRVQIQVQGAAIESPINGTFQVDSVGEVVIGPTYGAVNIKGLTRREAQTAIDKHLREVLTDPTVALTIDESQVTKPITGEHLVTPDGTVNLGNYGLVYIAGMTIPEAQAAIEKKLAEHFESPRISLDVYAYNSKVYYVIVQGVEPNGGDTVQRFPITGNETVLDALSQVNGLAKLPSEHIWIARSAAAGLGPDQILKVNWGEIFSGESTRTNYQVLPGDRVYIGSPPQKNARRTSLPASDPQQYAVPPKKTEKLNWAADLGPYRIDPPDIVLIDALRIVPKEPFVLQPLDVLRLEIAGTPKYEGFRELYMIDPDGSLNLGPKYGKVKIDGLSLKDAELAVSKHLESTLPNKLIKLTLNLNESAGQQTISGEHLVAPDGTISFDKWGSVSVAGMTFPEAKQAIETHLSKYFDVPKISVDVQSNSKFYYVILTLNNVQYGDNIQRFPASGNETVLDAIANIGGLRGIVKPKVWIERPTGDSEASLKFEITAEKFLQRGNEANLRLLPGDRLLIRGDSIRRMPNVKLPPGIDKYSITLKFQSKNPKRNYEEVYEIRWNDELTVLDALEQIGKTAEFAKANISLVRSDENDPKARKVLDIKLADIEKGKSATNYELQPNDRLIVDGLDIPPREDGGTY